MFSSRSSGLQWLVQLLISCMLMLQATLNNRSEVSKASRAKRSILRLDVSGFF